MNSSPWDSRNFDNETRFVVVALLSIAQQQCCQFQYYCLHTPGRLIRSRFYKLILFKAGCWNPTQSIGYGVVQCSAVEFSWYMVAFSLYNGLKATIKTKTATTTRWKNKTSRITELISTSMAVSRPALFDLLVHRPILNRFRFLAEPITVAEMGAKDSKVTCINYEEAVRRG